MCGAMQGVSSKSPTTLAGHWRGIRRGKRRRRPNAATGIAATARTTRWQVLLLAAAQATRDRTGCSASAARFARLGCSAEVELTPRARSAHRTAGCEARSEYAARARSVSRASLSKSTASKKRVKTAGHLLTRRAPKILEPASCPSRTRLDRSPTRRLGRVSLPASIRAAPARR